MEKKKIAALFASDIHLGSRVSRAELLVRALEEYDPDNIFIVGDMFDDLNLHKLHAEHWALLTALRNCSTRIRVVLIEGNHDALLSVVGKLIGIDVVSEFLWTYNGNRYLIIHGHQFDRYITEKPIVTAIASWFYFVIQYFGKKQKFARFVKRTSKKYLRLSEEIAPKLSSYAKAKGANIVIFGHTHQQMDEIVDGVRVVNDGCFTDVPSSYVTVDRDGLHHHDIE